MSFSSIWLSSISSDSMKGQAKVSGQQGNPGGLPMVISPCPILTGTCHVPVKAAKEEAAEKAAAQIHPVSGWD